MSRSARVVRQPRRFVAVTALAVVGSASACGNAITTDINGMTGVTVDESGRPLVVAELCGGVVAGVTVSGPNQGSEPNEIRADLVAAEPVDESLVLDLSSPPAGWTGQALELPLAPDLHIAYAHGGAEEDTQLTQVTFTSAELAELEPGEVQYGSHEPGEAAERTDAAAFPAVACPD